MFFEIVQFIFRGFWTFIGCLLILSVTLQGIASIFGAFIPSRDTVYNIDGSNIEVDEFLEWKKQKDEIQD